MGGNLAKGAWPLAISNMVMPTDQMSALLLYLQQQTATVRTVRTASRWCRLCHGVVGKLTDTMWH
jgi:hypothetical protein